MSGDQKGDKPEEQTERNLYLVTLNGCRDTLIPNATQAVYDGVGDPGSAIAGAINGGGWECTEADKWVTELTQHTSKVLPAFEDARTAVVAEISAERGRPEREVKGGEDVVPAGHEHGLAWSQAWHIRQHNI